MPKPNADTSGVTHIPRKPKPEPEGTTVHFVLTAQWVDSSGAICSRSDPGVVLADLTAGVGALYELVHARLTQGLPQAPRAVTQ